MNTDLAWAGVIHLSDLVLVGPGNDLWRDSDLQLEHVAPEKYLQHSMQ